MTTNTITPWTEVAFDDYLNVVEVELRRVGEEFMQNERITMEEVAAGQGQGLSPFGCARLIKLRLERENDATNDTKPQDSQG